MAEKENITKIPSNESAKGYVTEGITLNCTFGDSTVKLETPGRKTAQINDKLQANIMDFKPMVNIKSFGQCSCRANPIVASATAANHGILKKMPCVPNTNMPWINGKDDVMMDGAPPLLETSKNTCLWGGTISIGEKPQKKPNWGRVGEGATKVANGGLLCWLGAGALAAAGVALLVLTAPVSVPALVTAAAIGTVAAGGVGGALCLTTGASDINEGKQDIEYGMAGSNQESHNPLKEAVGPEAYYNAELIGTGLSLAAMAETPYLAPFAAAEGVGAAGTETVVNRELASQQQNPVKTSAVELEAGEVNAVEETKLAMNARTKPNYSRIRCYRGVDIEKVPKKYRADSRLVTEMEFKGKGQSGTNAAGWERNASKHFNQLLDEHPEYWSEANIERIESGHAPVVDETFVKNFPQYKDQIGDKLIHHHVGGGGQAASVPQSLHEGFGGIHNYEKTFGIRGNDSLTEIGQTFTAKP